MRKGQSEKEAQTMAEAKMLVLFRKHFLNQYKHLLKRF
jgi:hypothetical protein